jgi:hypothetical protein
MPSNLPRRFNWSYLLYLALALGIVAVMKGVMGW